MAKFLIVHPNLDIYGGGERVCHHIIKALVAHNQQVELLAFDFNETLYGEIMGEKLPSGITVHTLGKREIVEADPPLSVYKRRQNITRLLKKYKTTAQYDYTFSTQTLSAFETTLFDKADKNIAYVHFPEIPYDYEHSKRNKRMYLWLYKKLLERHIGELDLLFCNSNYTKAMTQKYWKRFGINEPIIAYPPVETPFWSDKPLEKRSNCVVYVARFVPQKRHEILKQLATAFPQLEFISIGLLRDTEQAWFEDFSKTLPANYTLKPNLSEKELIATLQNSTIYVHLMEGEHFGIAPMEALASGCVTFVHNSGGSGEFVPPEFRWESFEDLKMKIAKLVDTPNPYASWNKQREMLQEKISVLRPEKFEEQIWSHTESLMRTDRKISE
ncbi:MAG: glycosyltransferase [Nitrososphaerota archaeon]|jgi:glycosyltransferase involved in cell wall biosynthesis|nr:glycosyltransferase [Nitrososphaerota archaeon]